MDQNEDFEFYANSICREFQPLQNAFLEVYDINSYQNWYYDHDYGIFQFKNGNGPDLYFKYTEVGSFSTKKNTWMWSWDNYSTPMLVKRPMKIIRAYGETNHYARMTTGIIDGDEYTGWQMTSITAKLLNAIGGYRVPCNHLFVYFAFLNQITEDQFETIKLNTIQCDKHTYARMAFVCQHLITGEKRGFHEAFESDLLVQHNDDCQAWCNDCDDEWIKTGEWNNSYKAFTDMKIVCEECYFEIKERNL